MDPFKIVLLFMLYHVHGASAKTVGLKKVTNLETVGEWLVDIERKRQNGKVCTGIHLLNSWILTMSDCITKRLKTTEYNIVFKDGSKQEVIDEVMSPEKTFSLLKIKDSGKRKTKYAKLSDSISTPSKEDFYIYNTNYKGEVNAAKVDFVGDDKCENIGIIGIGIKGNKCYQVKLEKNNKRNTMLGRPVFTSKKNDDIILQGLSMATSKSCASSFQAMASVQPYLDWINSVINDCGQVQKIKFGRAIMDDKSKTTVGGTASVECNSGYTADKKKIVCQKSGLWEETSCTKNGCGSSIDLRNGALTFGTTTIGSIASVTCNSGYHPLKDYIECKKSGSWESPRCLLKDCGPVQKMENGKISLDTSDTSVGATATIKCDSGYKPKNKQIACLTTGEWTDAVCEAKDCGSLLPLPNGLVTFGTTTVGSIASVTCDSGYFQKKEYVKCQKSGSWETPLCENCGHVPKIKFGRAIIDDKSNTTVGGTASVECNSGYTADKKKIVCQKSGLWEETNCTKNGCGSSIDLRNGTLTFGTTTIGSIASVTCNSGYHPLKDYIECQKSGSWESPRCLLKDCGPVQKKENGNISLDTSDTLVGATATIKCDSGYEPKNKQIACLTTGKWTEAVCEAKDCGSLLPLPNGLVTFGTTTVGSIASVTCDSGYLQKKEYVKCQKSGSWETPLCENINDCTIDSCLNNGTCFDGVNGFTCNCTNGYIGSKCSIASTCKQNNKCGVLATSCDVKDCYIKDFDEDMVIENKTATGDLYFENSVMTLQKCRQICIDYSRPGGKCVAYSYYPNIKQCVIFGITPIEGLELKDNPNVTLYVLTCSSC